MQIRRFLCGERRDLKTQDLKRFISHKTWRERERERERERASEVLFVEEKVLIWRRVFFSLFWW